MLQNMLLLFVCFFILISNCFADSTNSVNVSKRSPPWPFKEYPNPWKKPGKCGRRFIPSSICDPDELLSENQVKALDELLWSHGKNAPCLCEECFIGRKGIPVGIALMEDILPPQSSDQDLDPLDEFAQGLRKSWKFGGCDNDVLILLTANQGAISFGKVSKHLLRNSKIAKLNKESFPFDKEGRFKFLEELLTEIHHFGRHSTRDDVSTISLHSGDSNHSDDDEFNLWSDSRLPINGSSLSPSSVASSAIPLIGTQISEEQPSNNVINFNYTGGESSLEKALNISETDLIFEKTTQSSLSSSSSPSSSSKSHQVKYGGTWGSNQFIAAQEYDEFQPKPKKGLSTSATYIAFGVLFILVICLIAFVLIIWYYRTRTGNIETGAFYNKNKPEVKQPVSIKATKYEPCKTDEPSATL